MSMLSEFVFGKKPEAETTPYSTLGPEQDYFLNEILLPYLITDPMSTPYTGQFTAPLSSLEQLGLSLIGEAASKPGFGLATKLGQNTSILAQRGKLPTPSGASLASDYLDVVGTPSQNNPPPQELVDALSNGLTVDPTDFTEYYQNSVEAPALKSLNEQILPTLSASYAPGGFYSSARLDQEAKVRSDTEANLVSALSELGYKSYESAADRALKDAEAYAELYGMGLSADTSATVASISAGQREADSLREAALTGAKIAPGLDQGEIALYSDVMKAGALPRSIQQADLTAQYNEFKRQIEEEGKKLDDYLNFLRTRTVENVTTVTPGSKGLLDYVLAGGGNAIGEEYGKKFLKWIGG